MKSKKDGPQLVIIDIDFHEKTVSDLNVTSIPCLILVRDGKVVQRLEGNSLQTGLDDFLKLSAELGSKTN